MKKTIVAVILLLLGSFITYFEVDRIERSKGDESVHVVVVKNNLKMGNVINVDDLQLKKIPRDLDTMYYYTNVDDIVGKSVSVDLYKDIILNKQMVSDKQFHDPSIGNAITAIKMLPEEILCWEVSMGDAIVIISVSKEGVVSEIGQVVVKGVYYQNSNQEAKYDNTPIFLLVEGTKEQIKSIIKHRNNGKIEGVKIGS